MSKQILVQKEGDGKPGNSDQSEAASEMRPDLVGSRTAQQTELTLRKYLPSWQISLQQLVDFGVLTKEKAIKLPGLEIQSKQDKDGQSWPKLNSHLVDNGLVGRLRQAGIDVPTDKVGLFGRNFSRVVDYNSALTALHKTKLPLLTKRDGASPELSRLLAEWYLPHSPFPQQGRPVRDAMEQARDKHYPPHTNYAIGVYLLTAFKAGKSAKEAVPGLAKLLKETADIVAGEHAYFSEYQPQELRLLADNAATVCNAYWRAESRIKTFVKQFGDLAVAVAQLYEQSNNQDTQHYAHEIIQFVAGRK